MPLAEFTAIAFVAPLVVTIRRPLPRREGRFRTLVRGRGFAGVLVDHPAGRGAVRLAGPGAAGHGDHLRGVPDPTRKFAGADDPVTTLFSPVSPGP